MDPAPEAILARHAAALARRRPIEPLWQACYDHALPAPGAAPLFDATAADAAEQLAASLLAELAPPWSRWFELQPARAADRAAPALAEAAEVLAGHLDRSNLTIELHQAFLDLVVAGTGVIAVEEAPPGEASALRFRAVPLREAVLEEGASGRLDTVFRRLRLTRAEAAARWPGTALPPPPRGLRPGEPAPPLKVVEAIWPDPRAGCRFAAVLEAEDGPPVTLAEGAFADPPVIAFRWLKLPGETYGRGPVAKALPDIRTANKVVELVLQNASVAATGIWQAEDDGVLNPATIRLVPGAIIAKAPGSAGLTPLRAAGDFDVSQLVLADLRERIRRALLADRIAAQEKAGMTATEVLERAATASRLLGATYGRLQAELLTPLVARCLGILRRRGEVPAIRLDGREVRLAYASPLARLQARADASSTLLLLEAAAKLGPEAAAVLDGAAAARWLARTLGAPPGILRPETPTPTTEEA